MLIVSQVVVQEGEQHPPWQAPREALHDHTPVRECGCHHAHLLPSQLLIVDIVVLLLVLCLKNVIFQDQTPPILGHLGYAMAPRFLNLMCQE